MRGRPKGPLIQAGDAPSAGRRSARRRFSTRPRHTGETNRLPALRDRRAARPQPTARGKFLFLGDEKLYVRGVTYGTFRPNGDGDYPEPWVVERDFRDMLENGINAVRTYSVPPRWLLDMAARHGLFVLVGLPWEQHVAFLEDRRRADSIVERVREGVRACAGHPAVLCYAIGNEIPAPIVRWHGRRRVERFIERLYRAAKAEDPEALVTYVNYPSTEYLQLPFLDLVCFNVYLESHHRLEAYLARLHNLAGDRPLVMAELGLDSRRHGEEAQAEVVGSQVRTAFAAGCAGAFVFAWTDEWHRGGYDVDEWDFGLTDRERLPKPALAAVRQAFREVPFPPDIEWPRVSVVVCTHNGASWLRDCLEGLMELEYPNYEVMVVDDGSTDATAAIAREHAVALITTENRGLASARNLGLQGATGEIVAYLDDDARPDPHWLTYLSTTFMTVRHAGVGGPNVPPPDGPIADAIANAPGGPIHILLSDQIAEHIPGCNMAFRKAALEAVGGFDPQFRAAGDDVDICWRMQERGWTIGFNPAAMVWHHRRDSVRAYLRQQVGYGKAEALLERKWPEKYNAAGHATWAGRLYATGTPRLGRRWHVYYGTWGAGLFQRLYESAPTTLASLPLMPEWSLVVVALAALSALGLLWTPLLAALPVFCLAAGLLVVEAGINAARGSFPSRVRSRQGRAKRRALTALLYVLQPVARLRGRVDHGLTPWRRRGHAPLALPRPRETSIWSEHWVSSADRLAIAEDGLRGDGVAVESGGDFDRWDLQVRGGILGAARMRMTIEEHGAGRQLVRFRAWPRVSILATALCATLALLTTGSALDAAWGPTVTFAGIWAVAVVRALYEAAVATGALLRALRRQQQLAVHDLEVDLTRRVHAASGGAVEAREA